MQKMDLVEKNNKKLFSFRMIWSDREKKEKKKLYFSFFLFIFVQVFLRFFFFWSLFFLHTTIIHLFFVAWCKNTHKRIWWYIVQLFNRLFITCWVQIIDDIICCFFVVTILVLYLKQYNKHQETQNIRDITKM